MDVLKAEIERKRSALKQVGVLCSERKYIKRSELNQFSADNTNLKRVTTNVQQRELKDKCEIEDKNASETEALAETDVPPFSEIQRRFRERGEPARFFGETDADAYRRLKILEASEPEMKGQRNDFKAAMDKIDKQYLTELLHGSDEGSEAAAAKASLVNVMEVGYTFEQILEMLKETGKGNMNLDCRVVLAYFKYVLKEWACFLNNRDNESKKSVQGRIETALYSQTVSYLKSLFRKLKTFSLQHDILDSLVDVVKNLSIRNYIRANEHFLELAIGNAPWPIGATNVGIHPRPGREKIASKHVAHVLNDETQRKYIQAVKRLISKSQFLFPTDPSHCVEFAPSNADVD